MTTGMGKWQLQQDLVVVVEEGLGGDWVRGVGSHGEEERIEVGGDAWDSSVSFESQSKSASSSSGSRVRLISCERGVEMGVIRR